MDRIVVGRENLVDRHLVGGSMVGSALVHPHHSGQRLGDGQLDRPSLDRKQLDRAVMDRPQLDG